MDSFKQGKPYIAVIKDGAGVGRTSILPRESSVLGTMQYILPRDLTDIRFLYYGLTSLHLERYARGATIPHIYFKDYKESEIPLPPLETQQHMAKTLGLATEIIEGYRQKLTELEKLVQSVFYEMFGDPVENEKGWENGTIRDVVESVKYGTSQPSTENGKYTYLRMNNITYDGYLDFTQLKRIDIDEKDYEKCVVRKNDVLFNRTNSKELVGKTCVFNLDEEMIIAGYIIRVRVNEKVLPIYLSRVLNSRYGKIVLADMCKSSIGQANINAQELQNIKILVPPLPLQEQFAQIVEKIQEEKALVQEGLREAEQLFGGLLEGYFEE